MTKSGVLYYFSAFMEALNCGAALVDRSGTIVAVNSRLAQMMETDAATLKGVAVRTLYEEDAARGQVDVMLAHFDTPHEGEFYLPLPGGRKRPVLSSANRAGEDKPLCDYRLVTMIDLSAQKEAEEGIKEQYRIITELSNTILTQAESLKTYSARLEERVRERTAELHAANLDAIYMLAVASEAKDEDTGRHVRRIEHYARLLSRELGMDEGVAEAIGYSAVLHDVGKMHVPDHILKKPGKLTDAERIAIQSHTIIGERILANRPFFARARKIARSHHENWDGSGYPDGLSGENIPLEARIVHLADVYDALTTPRVYKAAWSTYDAMVVIEEGAERMFDPRIVRAFIGLHERGALEGITTMESALLS
jgi:putative nucleotidyltransferase with HDIG domain